MRNPIITLREDDLQLSQRELAENLNASQQFILRHEKGMASTLPNRIGDYFDYHVSVARRLDLLADALTYATECGLAENIPNRYWPGRAGFERATSSLTTNLYSLWVRIRRAQLPDLSGLLTSVQFDPAFPARNAQEVQQVLSSLRVALGISRTSEPGVREDGLYEIAAALCIHPFVLSNFIRRADRLTGFPPTIRKALADTRRKINNERVSAPYVPVE